MADFALASRYLPVSKPGFTALRQASFVIPSFLVRSRASVTDLLTVLLSVSTINRSVFLSGQLRVYLKNKRLLFFILS